VAEEEITIGEVNRSVMRLTDEIASLRNKVEAKFVSTDFYNAAQSALRDDVIEVKADLKSLENRLSEREFQTRIAILTAFFSPLIVGIVLTILFKK
jgi:hypothetical protein